MDRKKKVLIISYYWPPAGGVSVLRSLRFVKYLKNFGWESIVIVPESADYPVLDPALQKEIPNGTEILKVKIIEPFKLFNNITGRKGKPVNPVYANDKKHFLDSIAIWIRGNLFIPDARFLWIFPTIRFLKKYIKHSKIDAIFTDGPPHTNTVIGTFIANKFDIPYLADFQDPWTQVDYFQLLKISKISLFIHKKLEQKAFKIAKKITIASPTWKKDIESIGAQNVDVVYYGYEENEFLENITPDKKDEFVITHTGILGHDRNPEIFFKAINHLITKDDYKDIRIILAGTVDYSVKRTIEKYEIQNYVKFLGNIPRKEAIKLLLNSNILLLPINKAKNANGRLPGKLYEYIRAMKPILALGIDGCDAQQIIKKTNTGELFPYDDFSGIYNFIKSIYSGNTNIKPHLESISEFNVVNQTKKLAQYLDEISK